MIISTKHLTDKIAEYKAVFGKNVLLSIEEDGSGSFDIGIRDVPNGFFMDSFDTFEECLAKNPSEAKANAVAWGWGWAQ